MLGCSAVPMASCPVRLSMFPKACLWEGLPRSMFYWSWGFQPVLRSLYPYAMRKLITSHALVRRGVHRIIIYSGGLPAFASTMVLPAERPLEWVPTIAVHPSLAVQWLLCLVKGCPLVTLVHKTGRRFRKASRQLGIPTCLTLRGSRSGALFAESADLNQFLRPSLWRHGNKAAWKGLWWVTGIPHMGRRACVRVVVVVDGCRLGLQQ